MSEELKPISDPQREERIEKLKKDMKGRPSGRPMGYIKPRAIKSILRGEEPSVSVSMYDPSKDEDRIVRKVGDVWTGDDGYIYEKHEGWTSRTSAGIKAFEEAGIYEMKKCSKCGSVEKNHLDKKFLAKRGKCFDCVVKEETHMRVTGQFETYSKKIMLSNLLSFLKDSKAQLQHYIDTAPESEVYFNDDGSQQKWDVDSQKLKDKFTEELKWVDDEITKTEEELAKLPEVVPV